MTLPRQINTRQMDSFVECVDGSVARRVKVCDPIETSDEGAASGFSISIHTTDATPGTENSFTIPAGTKRFCIRNRSQYFIKIGSAASFTTSYYSLFARETIDSGALDGTSMTVYVQSEGSADVLEILRWT